MTGRLEHEIKIDQNIQKKLDSAPAYITDWYYNLKASGVTASSCQNYIEKTLRFLSSLENGTELEKITLEEVQKYFISIQRKETPNGLVYTSDSYRQNIWCSLNSFFEYLYNTHKINENYMKCINKPKNRDLARINESRVLLTKDDFKKLIEVAENGVAYDERAIFGDYTAKKFDHVYSRDKAIMLLFLTTGMRKTALSEINIEDLDMRERTIRVIDKGDKLHVYNLSTQTHEALRLWLMDRNEIKPSSDALFVTEEGNRLHPNTIVKAIARYSEAALGYKISPHKLRAGFCSVLYEETKDIEFVRRAVGHSNIATTQRYIVTKGDERKRASKIIDNLLG